MRTMAVLNVWACDWRAACVGSYAWRGQEGSESDFVGRGTEAGLEISTLSLVYMYERHYDPTLGRFLQADRLLVPSARRQKQLEV